MSKIDHVATSDFERMWAETQKHVALPSSGAWSYQTEQHRRWHWLDYMMTLGAYPPMEDDWDWVYMLGAYADHANCVYFLDETGGVIRKRKTAPTADADVE